MRRGLLGLGLVPLSLLVADAIACGGSSHIYQGRLFVEGRDCLGSTSSLDVVEGEEIRECGPICLAQPHSDGGRTIYVSTQCAPFPYPFDASGSDPACAPALEALARTDTCFVDGGSANPAPEPAPSDAAAD